MKTNIWGYGISIPYHRLAPKAINQVWGNVPAPVVDGLGVLARGVVNSDEDTLTLALEAATRALDMSGLERDQVGALILGTQTSPYLTRPGAALLVEGLGIPKQTFAADLQFSSKSGTSALLAAVGYVQAGMAKAAIAIGADTLSPHVSPGDSAEYTAGSGAAAVVVAGPGGLASVQASASYTSDLPDWFRLDGERYIRTGGAAMTNTDVGMRKHTLGAWQALQTQADLEPTSFEYLVSQQTDPKKSFDVAKTLGFAKEQVMAGMVVDNLGDCGAASPLLGLAQVLDQAKAGEKIALVAYGAGAGSDALILETTQKIDGVTTRPSVQEAILRNHMVDYATYIKMERKYHTHQRKVSTFD